MFREALGPRIANEISNGFHISVKWLLVITQWGVVK